MIRRAVATRFDRIATSGRNRPLMVAVETDDGVEHEVHLKPSGRPELGIEGLANEALAACLAAKVDLPIFEPFLVEMSPAWIATIRDADTRAVLNASSSVAFASTSAGSGWAPWLTSDTLTEERGKVAVAILAFDAFIENRDRKPGNTNVLVKGDRLRIIDHELCFRIRQLLWPRPEPWKLGYLEWLTQPEGHVFAAALHRIKALDTGPIRAVWSALSDDDLADCMKALPPERAAATGAASDALRHLQAVCRRIDDCIAEIERALT